MKMKTQHIKPMQYDESALQVPALKINQRLTSIITHLQALLAEEQVRLQISK